MADLAHLLLPRDPPAENASSGILADRLLLAHEALAEEEAWQEGALRLMHCLLSPAACKSQSPTAIASAVTAGVPSDTQVRRFLVLAVSMVIPLAKSCASFAAAMHGCVQVMGDAVYACMHACRKCGFGLLYSRPS